MRTVRLLPTLLAAATLLSLAAAGTAAAQDDPLPKRPWRPPELKSAGAQPPYLDLVVQAPCSGSIDVTQHGDSWIEKRLNWRSSLECMSPVYFEHGSSTMAIKRGEDLTFTFPHGTQSCAGTYGSEPAWYPCVNEGSSNPVMYPAGTLYNHGVDFVLVLRSSRYFWAGPTTFCPDISADLTRVRCHYNMAGYVGGVDQYERIE